MTKALAGLVALAGAVIAAPPVDRLNRIIAWYDTYLKPVAPSPATRP